MDIFVSCIIPAIVGVFVGILSGLLGIGGGTILVPIFRLMFNMSPVMSTATSLFTIIPTSLSGAISHVRHKTCIPSLGIAAGLGGALTSPLGVWLATVSPGWLVMVVAAIVIALSAAKMLSKAVTMKSEKSAANKDGEKSTTPSSHVGIDASGQTSLKVRGYAATGSHVSAASVFDLPTSDAPAASSTSASRFKAQGHTAAAARSLESDVPMSMQKMTHKQLVTGVIIGLVAGVVSGYVGVGGGFIMVPLMLSVVGISMKQASGTSLIAVAILAIPGVIEQALLGNVQYLAGIAIAIGSIPGAVVGARLTRMVPERHLRFLFGGFLIVAAILLVLNEFGILG